MTRDVRDNLPSLVELLRRRAAVGADALAFTFLADGETERDRLTYAALDAQARAIAATLAERGVAPGARAILLFPPGLDFIAAFFGALYAGVVAVPCYPPHPSQVARSLARLVAVTGDAEPSIVLCSTGTIDLAPIIARHAPTMATLPWLATDTIHLVRSDEWSQPDVGTDTLAFLQYTSGSTASPRGVMVTHGNLLHNLAYAHDIEENTPESTSVSWLPVIHDMGLIEGVLQPAYAGYPAYLMAPTAFLQRPIRWLRAISRYRATNSGGPNFAYDLCTRKITPEQRDTLDLSSWSVAYNGAEPIRHDTLIAFHRAFEPCGFRWRSFYPVYGLAEATLVVSSGRRLDEPVTHVVAAPALGEGRLVPASGEGQTSSLVACGPVGSGTHVAIVDPDTLLPLGDGLVGEVWIASPSVARGYWRRHEDTEKTFNATLPDDDRRYLRTGDLGAWIDGQLAIVGRIKDMLIVHGMKYAPQDLENTAERQHAAIRPGCAAAFAAVGGGPDGEEIVLAVEIDRRQLEMGREDRDSLRTAEGTGAAGLRVLDDLAMRIHRAVFDEHGIQLHGVLLVHPGGVPRTSSGKVRRHACAQAYGRAELREIHRWAPAVVPRSLPPSPATVAV
jgi:acyl-CoA synthetase (AMP-forming)/AMP-acid ligase II